MVDLIIVVVSLVITASGTICVPLCRNARNDVIEHVVIVNEVPCEFEEMDSSK